MRQTVHLHLLVNPFSSVPLNSNAMIPRCCTKRPKRPRSSSLPRRLFVAEKLLQIKSSESYLEHRALGQLYDFLNAFSLRSLVRFNIKTFAPFLRNPFANANPVPEVVPVFVAVLPFCSGVLSNKSPKSGVAPKARTLETTTRCPQMRPRLQPRPRTAQPLI